MVARSRITLDENVMYLVYLAGRRPTGDLSTLLIQISMGASEDPST